jgi:hypothetical protein
VQTTTPTEGPSAAPTVAADAAAAAEAAFWAVDDAPVSPAAEAPLLPLPAVAADGPAEQVAALEADAAAPPTEDGAALLAPPTLRLSSHRARPPLEAPWAAALRALAADARSSSSSSSSGGGGGWLRCPRARGLALAWVGDERERLVTTSSVMTKSWGPSWGNKYPENGLVKPPRHDTRPLSPAGLFGGRRLSA